MSCHLLTIRQSIENRHGLCYANVGNTIATSSKTVFVKIALPREVFPISSKTFKPLPSRGKMKRYVFMIFLD